MQLGGAVRADRGRIILQIRWNGIPRSETRGNASPSLNYSWRSRGIGRTHHRMWGQTQRRPHVRCCSTDPAARKHERFRTRVWIQVRPGDLLDKPTPSVYCERDRARYPSGKGEVCKTFIRRFDSDPRLQHFLAVAGNPST